MTTKAASQVSVEQPTRRPRPAKKTPKNAAQAAKGGLRWAGVNTEERTAQMRELARQRWAADDKGQAEAELYFKTADLDEALETYQSIRAVLEMAGKVIDTRFQAERQNEERCSNPQCPTQAKFDRNNPWYYRNSVKDPVTSRIYNVFACSPACMVAVGAPGTKPLPAPQTDARFEIQNGRMMPTLGRPDARR